MKNCWLSSKEKSIFHRGKLSPLEMEWNACATDQPHVECKFALCCQTKNWIYNIFSEPKLKTEKMREKSSENPRDIIFQSDLNAMQYAMERKVELISRWRKMSMQREWFCLIICIKVGTRINIKQSILRQVHLIFYSIYGTTTISMEVL